MIKKEKKYEKRLLARVLDQNQAWHWGQAEARPDDPNKGPEPNKKVRLFLNLAIYIYIKSF